MLHFPVFFFFFHFFIVILAHKKKKLLHDKSEVVGQRYGHLRAEQYRCTIHQLLACAHPNGKIQCRRRTVWYHHQCLCLYLFAHHPAHLRYGDHLLPFHEQGRRESRESLFHHAAAGADDLYHLCGGHLRVPAADSQRDVLRRPSGICVGDVLHRCRRCVHGDTVCLSAVCCT